MKKVLVVDDQQKNLDAAIAQLGDEYEIITAQTFDKAKELLNREVNYARYKEIMVREGFGEFDRNKVSEEEREKWREVSNKAKKEATNRHVFDIVITDVFMPGEETGIGERGKKHVGEMVPIGLVVALLALKLGVKEIFILSDTNHHDHPVAWAMDEIEGNFSNIKVLAGFGTVGDAGVKQYSRILK